MPQTGAPAREQSLLLDDLSVRTPDEIFTEVLVREYVRIERIVLTGNTLRLINRIIRSMTNGCYFLPVGGPPD